MSMPSLGTYVTQPKDLLAGEALLQTVRLFQQQIKIFENNPTTDELRGLLVQLEAATLRWRLEIADQRDLISLSDILRDETSRYFASLDTPSE